MDSQTERGRLKAAPNVTPLVDVVLVLLILFIILVPAVDASVKLPRARHSTPCGGDDGESALLVLTGDEAGPGQIRMETEPGHFLCLPLREASAMRTLVSHLRSRVAHQSAPQVVLKADGRLSFRHVQTVFDLCREAGTEMVLAATAADDSQPFQGGLR